MYRKYRIVESIANSVSQYESYRDQVYCYTPTVKNSRQEPTPSNGSLPQSMAAPPARRVLGMRTRSFNKTGFDWLIDWYALFHPKCFVISPNLR